MFTGYNYKSKVSSIERLNGVEAISGSVRRKKWYILLNCIKENLKTHIAAPFSDTEIFIFGSTDEYDRSSQKHIHK